MVNINFIWNQYFELILIWLHFKNDLDPFLMLNNIGTLKIFLIWLDNDFIWNEFFE